MAILREELAVALPGLQKAVFSQPVDKHSDQKVTVRPVRVKGKLSYQVERFRDNKAFHQNRMIPACWLWWTMNWRAAPSGADCGGERERPIRPAAEGRL